MDEFWAEVGPPRWRNHILRVVKRYSEHNICKEEFDKYPDRALRIYEEWLALSGLEMRHNKTRKDLDRELSMLGTQCKNLQSVTKHYYHRNLDYIQHVIEDEKSAAYFNDAPTYSAAQPFPHAPEGFPDINGFFEMIGYLDRWSNFVWTDDLEPEESRTWLEPMIRLWHRRCQWIRSIEDWRPESDDPRQQFASLLRHLIANYDVPSFMDSAWLGKGGVHAQCRDAWVHVAWGNNIRTAKFLRLRLSKKSAHYFMSAPEDMTFDHALKWAHMKTFNLRPRAIAAMLGSQWGLDFENQPFWNSVLRFLAANPMIAAEQIGPIIDYIYSQKFYGPVLRYEEYAVGHEYAVRDDPPHPGFSMRGRTGQALLDQIETWHRELGQTSTSQSKDAVYRESGWSPWEDPEKLSEDEIAIWEFVEILTEKDLHEEGRTLRHCIYSYHARVAAGDCSVWSLRRKYTSGPKTGWMERKLTVEVSSTGRINEARGFANKLPEGRAKILLQQWADKNSLSIAPYVFL